MSTSKTIAFFGASGGCGLAALKHALAAGDTCVAQCRTPSKLSAIFPEAQNPKLVIKQGNAHDVEAVAACLINPSDPSHLVDAITFSIGGVMDFAKMSLDDPDVCKKGMAAILAALQNLRNQGINGKPLISVVSTCGISELGRDFPTLELPLYNFMLKVPHADKKVMEENLVASQENWVIIRPSLLVDPKEKNKHKEEGKEIRVGVEDPIAKKLESKAIGYYISREAVGKWIFENVLRDGGAKYQKKAVSITF
jgi:hypothetical protein